ncbi:MAG: cysteine desulfurase [Candidatus Delongbacteria bacterium]|nr:cysteine desulfurase [Candidatus Delongbacteria bacterium]
MIYLDYAATTPLDPTVIEEMYNFMKSCYGNPSSKYYEQSEQSKTAIRTARERVANLFNCKPEDILFNSGATEGNNFILKGIADAYKHKGQHIITSVAEHKAILSTCKYLETQGYDITYLPVNKQGVVELESLEKAFRNDTILVSIMWANNEIGSINDINTISKKCKEQGILFHTDATQIVGKLPIDLKQIEVDFLTCSAHKLYGPKGIGATFIRSSKYGRKPKITPLIHGGAQENGLRAGTESLHNIVGFGKACEISQSEMNNYIKHIEAIENDIIEQLKTLPTIQFNSPKDNKIPGIINFSIPGINNEFAIKMLSEHYSISSGSACAIGEPSHVLKELGNEESDYFRISLGKFTKNIDITEMVNTLKQFT